jgi:enoyl-[acyl-carrier protein] reductase II
MYSFDGNRVVRDTGSAYPIFNAPIGYFARGQLVGAVSAAGGMGLMETSSAGLDEVKAEFDRARAQTNHPIGLQMFLKVLKAAGRIDEVLDWALDGRTRFLASCVGDPGPYLPRIHAAGVKLYHQVGSLQQALKAQDAGVDGLILEGAESGGLRGEKDLQIFSLLQQVRRKVDLPIVAAGGIVDGHGMAGAFALGAEGVMMGTRFVSCAESPVHAGWKQAVVESDATLRINIGKPGINMRVIRNAFSEAVSRGEIPLNGNPYAGPFMELFNHGRTDLAMVGAGESAVLIEEVQPAAEIIASTVDVFWLQMERLAGLLKPLSAKAARVS